MDCSPEYIKMCDCPEIQGKAKWLISDWTANEEDDEWLSSPICLVMPRFIKFSYDGCVWLPRQDQLQEMVLIGKDDAPCSRTIKFVAWLSVFDEELAKVCLLYGSMEQLWLAFVMKQLYNKAWSNGEWVVS